VLEAALRFLCAAQGMTCSMHPGAAALSLHQWTQLLRKRCSRQHRSLGSACCTFGNSECTHARRAEICTCFAPMMRAIKASGSVAWVHSSTSTCAQPGHGDTVADCDEVPRLPSKGEAGDPE
jgi:hypothetical protein